MLSLILTALISLAPAEEFKEQDYCPLITYMSDESITEVIKCLKTENKKKIVVVSPGGNQDPSDVLIEYVNKNKITVLCVRCYSMAAFLWLNANKRELGEGAEIMLHYMSVGINGRGNLTIKYLRDKADELERETESYLKNLKAVTRQHFIEKMKIGDYYFGQSVIDLHEIKYTLINKPKQVEQ